MARIRTVKPEFWQSESLSALDPMTRLLAIGLLNHSDDEGYFRATPALIRAAVFPFDDSANIPRMIQELSSAGYLRLGTTPDGRQYGWIVNFLKHQRVDKGKLSEIKDLCEFQEHSTNPPRSIKEPSKQERKGKEVEKEVEVEGKGIRAADAAQAVFEYWCKVMGKGTLSKLTPKRLKAIEGVLRQGYTFEQIQQAIDGCKRSSFHMGNNAQKTVYDDLTLICRSGEDVERFIQNVGAGAGVETIDQFRDRTEAQAERVAEWYRENMQ